VIHLEEAILTLEKGEEGEGGGWKRSKLVAHLRKFTYGGANSFTLLRAWRRGERGRGRGRRDGAG